MAGKKIAVLISGQMRTFDRCIENLRENLFHLECDTYVHTSPDPDTEDKMALFDFTGVKVEDDPELLKDRDYIGRPEHYQLENWAYRIYSQLYKNRRVWDLMGDRRYDWVIRLRPDTIMTRKLDFLHRLKERTLYIPNTDSHGGLNDRFGLGDYEVMRAYMCRFDELEEYLDMGGILHSEENLKYAMLKHGFSVKQIPLAVILRRPDHDQELVRKKYDRYLWWWRKIPHVRDRGNWNKAYEDERGRYISPNS